MTSDIGIKLSVWSSAVGMNIVLSMDALMSPKPPIGVQFGWDLVTVKASAYDSYNFHSCPLWMGESLPIKAFKPKLINHQFYVTEHERILAVKYCTMHYTCIFYISCWTHARLSACFEPHLPKVKKLLIALCFNRHQEKLPKRKTHLKYVLKLKVKSPL